MRASVAFLVVLACAPAAFAEQRQSTPAQPPKTTTTTTAPATPPARSGQPAPAPKPAPPPPQSAAAPEAYTYKPDGRRDPFLSLTNVGADTKATSKRNEGPAGMVVAEIAVKGIMQSKGTYIAMIQGPDKKTYIVHPGDKLLDGTIKTISSTELVVTQEVNDPLSLVKTREIHKPLRTIEDAKE